MVTFDTSYPVSNNMAFMCNLKIKILNNNVGQPYIVNIICYLKKKQSVIVYILQDNLKLNDSVT